ncbi:uncharacterized protein LOC134235051 [Saccostrea cucullata]|uniref:uncharacterized protein LOC134235051 n=1 Tax=Saccostrea cuccullata TaxID=36930 RepID=UPI002ED32B72
MEATILACFLLMFVDFPSHAVAQGDIESIIQNAVDRAFGDVSGGGGTLAVGSFGPPDGGLARPAPRVLGQIPAFRTTETRQEPSAASGAAGALARFSQTNSPSLNAIISDRFKRTLNATMFAAEQLSSGPMGLRESLNRVTSDPSVTEIFQRLVTKFCFARPTCDIGNPYRRVDGQCNNLRDPLLGSSGTPQQRVLSPAYESRYYYAIIDWV